MTAATVFPLKAREIVFDFESGDLAKEGWTIREGENPKPIGNRTTEFHNNTVPYDKHGDYYLTTLETTANDAPTDGQPLRDRIAGLRP